MDPVVPQAAAWVSGRRHALGKSDKEHNDVNEPRAGAMLHCPSLEALIVPAWEKAEFMCTLGPEDTTGRAGSEGGTAEGGRGLARVCEVSGSSIDVDCVFVVRDVTDRVKRIEIERQALSAAVARQKDEETNRFTRHEVISLGHRAAHSRGCDARLAAYVSSPTPRRPHLGPYDSPPTPRRLAQPR